MIGNYIRPDLVTHRIINLKTFDKICLFFTRFIPFCRIFHNQNKEYRKLYALGEEKIIKELNVINIKNDLTNLKIIQKKI